MSLRWGLEIAFSGRHSDEATISLRCDSDGARRLQPASGRCWGQAAENRSRWRLFNFAVQRVGERDRCCVGPCGRIGSGPGNRNRGAIGPRLATENDTAFLGAKELEPHQLIGGGLGSQQASRSLQTLGLGGHVANLNREEYPGVAPVLGLPMVVKLLEILLILSSDDRGALRRVCRLFRVCLSGCAEFVDYINPNGPPASRRGPRPYR
jgi:hypothetical protein